MSEAGVAELISNLNPNKATGPDGISPRILKEAGATIAPSLTRLIKLSLIIIIYYYNIILCVSVVKLCALV